MEKKKILVIRFSSLGDVVLTTVIFPNIKKHWPDSEVSVLTKVEYAELFDNNPFIDHVVVLDETKQSFSELGKEIREGRFDVIIDLQMNPKSWYIRFVSGPPIAIAVKKLRFERWKLVYFKQSSQALEASVKDRILDCLKPLEVPIVNTETQLFPKKSEMILSAFLIDPNLKLIGIAPGAKHNTKRWSHERFAEAANRLGSIPGSLIVLLGDKSDGPVADKILPLLRVPYKNLIGWTSLKELIAVTSQLSFLLTNDSGLLHIAEALKIPLVALFGPTVRALGFAPYRSSSRVVEVINLPCRPCTFHGDEQCPLKHHKCMEDIDINAVLYAASSVFKQELLQPN